MHTELCDLDYFQIWHMEIQDGRQLNMQIHFFPLLPHPGGLGTNMKCPACSIKKKFVCLVGWLV